MRKISVVMPVLNEAKLLQSVLASIEPHVDEIVIIDGGTEGPSTDDTAAIAKSHDKVVYRDGKFVTRDGAWDMATQKNTGIAHATGDVLMFMSADMFFTGLEHLRTAVEEARGKIFFCTSIEFWGDLKHLRLNSADGDILSIPSNVIVGIAVDTCYTPAFYDAGVLELEGPVLDDRVMLPQVTQFHLGWIRPFGQQVAKHIRNLKQHRWHDEGEKILRGSERSIEQWAIQHVLSYTKTQDIMFSGQLPPELESLGVMKYDDGAKAFLAVFEEKYGASPFKSFSTTQGD